MPAFTLPADAGVLPLDRLYDYRAGDGFTSTILALDE